jgi:hypothetical protein
MVYKKRYGYRGASLLNLYQREMLKFHTSYIKKQKRIPSVNEYVMKGKNLLKAGYSPDDAPKRLKNW